jgi:hypothetical protein
MSNQSSDRSNQDGSAGPIPVEFGHVFTHGAFAAGGFEAVRNFDALQR